MQARKRFAEPLVYSLFGTFLKNTATYQRRKTKKRLVEYGRRTGRSKAPPNGGNVALIGHVFAPTGRGEDVRACFRALKAGGVESRIVDIFGLAEPDECLLEELWAFLVEGVGDAVNIFFINADEVATVLAHLRATGRFAGRGYNIVFPVWELAHYPAEWARQLDRFDEIWVPTRFIHDSIAPQVRKPVALLPFASELRDGVTGDRAELGLPEGRYLFLYFFDFTSYIERKNPFAVLQAFELFLRDRPGAEATLVLKLSGVHKSPQEFGKLSHYIAPFKDHVLLLDRILSDEEMAGLLRCCDCFVSLHRSEGFGRGLAEAMSKGKPVIATAYSGNMDFMNADNALLVDYELVPVAEGGYPFATGQVWAEANIDQAANYMALLYDDPAFGRLLGKRAKDAIRKTNGYMEIGALYRDRILAIERARDSG